MEVTVVEISTYKLLTFFLSFFSFLTAKTNSSTQKSFSVVLVYDSLVRVNLQRWTGWSQSAKCGTLKGDAKENMLLKNEKIIRKIKKEDNKRRK
jgi:hypothetical protein